MHPEAWAGLLLKVLVVVAGLALVFGVRAAFKLLVPAERPARRWFDAQLERFGIGNAVYAAGIAAFVLGLIALAALQ